MGTSSSYRAPSSPRWQAFVTALESDYSLDRIRSELFNAGNEWEQALSDPAVASYAQSLLSLYSDLANQLEQSERADVAVRSIISTARQASFEAGFTPAVAIADRAFTRVLLSKLNIVLDEGTKTAREVANHWRTLQGSEPRDFVVQYAGEVLAQYARHVVDREAGRLAFNDKGAHVSARLADALADRATEIGCQVASETLSEGRRIRDTWPDLISQAFERGKAIPQVGS